ncbi:MAG: hypothetical protein K0Q76_2785 [Panacagrimonas sp.]|jgi:hypothetical protein|nr:hypothetical protein [Panacagrimonas sp.]MCC2657677.1 hypothetical protein [Panacagrimonas sp.]
MKSVLFKSLVAMTLSAALVPAMAQSSGNGGGTSGNGGVSGVSGVSGGLGIDFFASQTPGANHEKGGGFADAIERAFGTPNADCGKLKCD